MNDSIIGNVMDTAYMVAQYRALESERSDALFVDPLAALLAGEHGRRIVASLPRNAFLGGWTVIIRTRVIDEMIAEAIAQGVDTVLNIGAGLDSRPYRMSLPSSLQWVEVDFPRMIEQKELSIGISSPVCQLKRIKADLADVEDRRRCLKDVAAHSKKILVLTEGVIPYLTEDSVAALASDLHDILQVKYWITDYFSPQAYRYRRRSKMTAAMKNAPFKFEPQDYFDFFSRCGWWPAEVRYLAEAAERFGRPAPFPFSVKVMTALMGLFMSEDRRKLMKRHSGYVLFEPR